MKPAYEDYVHPMPPHAKKVFQGKIFSVWQWEQRLFDGSTTTYERIARNDTAHTVGVLPDETILLTEDEQPGRDPVITPPGGVIDPGETPEHAAGREFLEETGYEVGTLIPWHVWKPGGKTEWKVHAFIGRDLHRVGDPQPSAGERATIKVYTFDEFLRLGSHPKMRDLMIRIILLEALLYPEKKKELQQLLYG